MHHLLVPHLAPGGLVDRLTACLRRARTAAVAATLAAVSLVAIAESTLPITVLRSNVGIQGLPSTDLSTLSGFRTAATVHLFAVDRTTGQTREVHRAAAGSNSAVYGARPSKAAGLLPGFDVNTALFDFMQDGDTAQAWATMTASGVPHLVVRGQGHYRADASAAWHARIKVPGTTAATREVVLSFVIPPVGVAGTTEQEGIGPWRARVRADLVVNGLLAWHTEALRLVLEPRVVNKALVQDLVLQQFGHKLGFPSDDEDDDPDNSSMNNLNGQSSARTVHLSLGRHAGGTMFDLALTFRALAYTEPKNLDGSDSRCAWNALENRYFCSRSNAQVAGGISAPPRVTYVP